MSVQTTAKPSGAPRQQYGTYYMMSAAGKGRTGPPWPLNPYPGAPVYQQEDGSFLVDDRAEAAALAMLKEQAAKVAPHLMESESLWAAPAFSSLMFGTNELWLEITDLDTTNNLISLLLHNTRQHFYYQLLSNVEVATTNWAGGEVVLDIAGTNAVSDSPVSMDGLPENFFRARQVEQVAYILAVDPDANKPTDTNGTGFDTGQFEIYRSNNTIDEALTVYFKIGGTATNGVNYNASTNGGAITTNLATSVTIPAGSGYASVEIYPLYDGVVDFDKTVTLTLIASNYYVLDTNRATATVDIHDNPFTVVATNIPSPIGIDYSPTTNGLIVSLNLRSVPVGGEPFNFLRLGTNGSGQLTTQQWSGVHGVEDEVKLAVVQTNIVGQFTNRAGFTNGDLFFGSDNAIGWLAADGGRSNLNLCTLTNSTVTNALNLRGSLYVDRTGTWSNQLIAVTSDTAPAAEDKGIWRIDSHAHPTLITNIFTRHLEGVITLTNDTQKWGPWAGKIITGDEWAVDENFNSKPLI